MGNVVCANDSAVGSGRSHLSREQEHDEELALTFLDLPPELIVQILSHMPAKDMAIAMATAAALMIFWDEAASERAFRLTNGCAALPADNFGGGLIRMLKDVEEGRGRASMRTGAVYRLESCNFPRNFIHVDSRTKAVWIATANDYLSRFRCVPQICGAGTVSFESIAEPGRFLRHGAHRRKVLGRQDLHKTWNDNDDGTEQHLFLDELVDGTDERRDFAFILRPAPAASRNSGRIGRTGNGGVANWEHRDEECVALEAANRRGSLLRHQYGRLKMHQCAHGGEWFCEDASWRLVECQ
uniref:F-box domain-containing protein n=1 Tax=Haptolina brevifila TaxID=156173 RepID=A0A7S2FN01_9EUKA